MQTNNIVSFSGGKDSTAMLLMMLEHNEDISSVVFFDTGWEFPALLRHVNKLEKYTGLTFVRLKPKEPFDYLLNKRPIKRRSGDDKGVVYRYGNGWPSWFRRWCTGRKLNILEKYQRDNPGIYCVGFAYDEQKRIKTHFNKRYPLIEYKVTGEDALKYCYSHGFDWEGLYKDFVRVSCFCCPLQRIGELRMLYNKYPDLWNRMLKMEAEIPEGIGRRFKKEVTVSDLDNRFKNENKQQKMF